MNKNQKRLTRLLVPMLALSAINTNAMETSMHNNEKITLTDWIRELKADRKLSDYEGLMKLSRVLKKINNIINKKFEENKEISRCYCGNVYVVPDKNDIDGISIKIDDSRFAKIEQTCKKEEKKTTWKWKTEEEEEEEKRKRKEEEEEEKEKEEEAKHERSKRAFDLLVEVLSHYDYSKRFAWKLYEADLQKELYYRNEREIAEAKEEKKKNPNYVNPHENREVRRPSEEEKKLCKACDVLNRMLKDLALDWRDNGFYRSYELHYYAPEYRSKLVDYITEIAEKMKIAEEMK